MFPLIFSAFSFVDSEQCEFPLIPINKTNAAAFENYQKNEPNVVKKGVRLMDYSNFKAARLSDFSFERSSDDVSASESELDTEAAHYTTSTDVSCYSVDLMKDHR